MEKRERELTRRELEIMKAIWDAGTAQSMQEIKAYIEQNYQRECARVTISVYLNQMVEKGYLSSVRKGRVFYYSSLIDAQEYRKKAIAREVAFWYGERVDEFFAAFMKEQDLTAEEKEKIRRVFEGLDW